MKEEIITLAKGGKIISEESELENIFSNYFRSIAEGLGLEHPEIFQEYNKQVENAIKTFKNHPSSGEIKSNISPTKTFSFAFLNTDAI